MVLCVCFVVLRVIVFYPLHKGPPRRHKEPRSFFNPQSLIKRGLDRLDGLDFGEFLAQAALDPHLECEDRAGAAAARPAQAQVGDPVFILDEEHVAAVHRHRRADLLFDDADDAGLDPDGRLAAFGRAVAAADQHRVARLKEHADGTAHFVAQGRPIGALGGDGDEVGAEINAANQRQAEQARRQR